MENDTMDLTKTDYIEVPDEEISFDGDFTLMPNPLPPPKFQEDNVVIRPYKADDGMKMLANFSKELKAAGLISGDIEKQCREAEQEGLAFTVIYEGEIVACAGIIEQREGVGLAWALFPLDIGKYHIDPRITKDKLKELIEKHNFWRVEATVRADFPAGQSYMRYLGFKVEGIMKKNEPDKTDSFLYAITR